jgi:hypothetical protein
MAKMYYKVLKNNRVIDVLDRLIFVKYQHKHGIMIACDQSQAQAIISSDKKHIWHVSGLYGIPVDGYDTVDLVEIDQYEYNQLKILNLKTPEEIIDEYTLLLIEGGIL